MSLFDVIKYNDIDLNSIEDLHKLPLDLFSAYRRAAFLHYNNPYYSVENFDLEATIKGMAEDWTDYSDDTTVIKRKIFDKVLREYNEHI